MEAKIEKAKEKASHVVDQYSDTLNTLKEGEKVGGGQGKKEEKTKNFGDQSGSGATTGHNEKKPQGNTYAH